MLLFRRSSDPFIDPEHRGMSLFWVHTDVVRQISLVYIYLLVKITIY